MLRGILYTDNLLPCNIIQFNLLFCEYALYVIICSNVYVYSYVNNATVGNVYVDAYMYIDVKMYNTLLYMQRDADDGKNQLFILV